MSPKSTNRHSRRSSPTPESSSSSSSSSNRTREDRHDVSSWTRSYDNHRTSYYPDFHRRRDASRHTHAHDSPSRTAGDGSSHRSHRHREEQENYDRDELTDYKKTSERPRRRHYFTNGKCFPEPKSTSFVISAQFKPSRQEQTAAPAPFTVSSEPKWTIPTPSMPTSPEDTKPRLHSDLRFPTQPRGNGWSYTGPVERYSTPLKANTNIHAQAPSFSSISAREKELGQFRCCVDEYSLSGDEDVGDTPTSILLFQDLSHKYTGKSFYNELNENLGSAVSKGKSAIVSRVLMIKHRDCSTSSTNEQSEPDYASFAFAEFATLELAASVLKSTRGNQGKNTVHSMDAALSQHPLSSLSDAKVSYVSLGSFYPASQYAIENGYTFQSAGKTDLEYWNRALYVIEYPPKENAPSTIDKSKESAPSTIDKSKENEDAGYALYQQQKHKKTVIALPKTKTVISMPKPNKTIPAKKNKTNVLQSKHSRGSSELKGWLEKNAALVNRWQTTQTEMKQNDPIPKHKEEQEILPTTEPPEADTSAPFSPPPSHESSDFFIDSDTLSCFLCSYKGLSTRDLVAHQKSRSHQSNMNNKQRVDTARLMLEVQHQNKTTFLQKESSEDVEELATGVGARMLASMGWAQNTGLGARHDGIRSAIIPDYRRAGHGIGAPATGMPQDAKKPAAASLQGGRAHIRFLPQRDSPENT